jgi:predicted NAD/FAD-dependent oxidoreductase
MVQRSDPGVVVVGAGVCGASAARALTDAGFPVVVHDKGRVPGGRAATRSRTNRHFDHGAQYFTSRDPGFLAQVESWARRGDIAEWHPRLVSINADGIRGTTSPERRWVAVPGMSRLAESMLGGIDVRCNSSVIGLTRADGGWQLHLADGSADGPYQTLLCSLPGPQVGELLRGHALASLAAEVKFSPCWASMLEFAEPLDVAFDAAFVNVGPLSWVARDSSKPGRPAGERWLVHAGPDYSHARLEDTAESVAVELQRAFFAAIGVDPRPPLWSAAHRWRYALAQPPLDVGSLVDAPARLVIGGDWCHGSRVEGAWLSGRAMAQQVIRWFDGAAQGLKAG